MAEQNDSVPTIAEFLEWPTGKQATFVARVCEIRDQEQVIPMKMRFSQNLFYRVQANQIDASHPIDESIITSIQSLTPKNPDLCFPSER
mmetsp:Transcript_33268/g.52008  ORF Transcript_33268/g.52008 Transcript_33268/m.52008 type:complete len:89 (-) Transcript_33268:544-810(-)